MLKTSKNSNFNQISAEYVEELKKYRLEIGKTRSFRFLDSKINPDPDERRQPGKEMIWKQSDFILGRDLIKDPFSGDLVDIGVVKTFDKEGNPTIEKLYVQLKNTQGYLHITGGDPEKEKWLDFLLICNENESNPHRNTDVKAKFKMIDADRDAKAENDADDTLTDMLQYVKEASAAQRKELALAFGWDSNESSETTLRRLRQVVKSNPEKFKTTIGNTKDLAIRSTINEALAAGVVTYSPMERKYTFAVTNETIATFEKMDGKEALEQFVDFIKTSQKGTPILTNIKKQLKATLAEIV